MAVMTLSQGLPVSILFFEELRRYALRGHSPAVAADIVEQPVQRRIPHHTRIGIAVAVGGFLSAKDLSVGVAAYLASAAVPLDELLSQSL